MSDIDLSAVLAPGEVAIGVDIGGTKTLAVAFGPRGPLASARVATIRGAEGIVDSLHRAVATLRAHDDVATGNILSIGIGIPGIVDSSRGIVSHGVNVGVTDELPLARLIRDVEGVPTGVTNDVSAATIGAAHTAGVSNDAALIALGTGLAAGFLISGEPRAGFTYSAGEIGHIPYVLHGLPCQCGQRGCLELYASGSALDRLWPTPVGVKAGASLFAAAAAGDEEAITARTTWVRAIAHAVTIVGLTVDVEAIFIGGGLSEIGEPLRAAIQAELEERASTSAFLEHLNLAGRFSLVPSQSCVGAIGAALVGLRQR